MHASGLMLIAALTLHSVGMLAQGPWGNVKSWTGTITIEATDTVKNQFGVATLTYKATGPFTAADEMMPDGSHMQWPMPGVETLSDPNKAKTAYDVWQARVVATYNFKGVDEMGKPTTLSCSADHQAPSRAGVTVNPTADEYVFVVTAPEADFTCSDKTKKRNLSTGPLRKSSLRLTGPRGAPGQVNNTKDFTIETTTAKVTFNMAPAK